jgi:hypothetical protein
VGNVINAQMLFNRVRMWMAGIAFGGRRDLYELFGYERLVDYRNFTAMYYRNGIAKTVVDLPVRSTWADPPQLGADNPEFNQAWADLCDTSSLWSNIMRLDKLAGLGRFAVMVVGFDDGLPLDLPLELPANWTQYQPFNIPVGWPALGPLQSWEAPIKPKAGRKVLYLQPYHEAAISILQWETDTTNPRFGRPLMYNINPGRFLIEGLQATIAPGMNAVQLRQPFNVHHSRVVHIAENLLEDQTFGCSRMEAVFNDVNDMMKVSGGSAELFWTLANRGMQVNVDKEMDLSPEDAKELQSEVENYQHQIQRFIRTRGVDIKDLGSVANHADPINVAKVLIMMISAGTGIPQQMFWGSAGGNVASHQDRANWSDRVSERVTEYAEPIVLKRFLDCMINAGVCPAPQNLQISWPEAFKLSPLERAQTSAQMARSAVNLTKAKIQSLTASDEQGNSLDEPSLFTDHEMRRIVSFGKHPPVFDDPVPTGDTPLTGQSPDPKVDADTGGVIGSGSAGDGSPPNQ